MEISPLAGPVTWKSASAATRILALRDRIAAQVLLRFQPGDLARALAAFDGPDAELLRQVYLEGQSDAEGLGALLFRLSDAEIRLARWMQAQPDYPGEAVPGLIGLPHPWPDGSATDAD